MPPPSRLTPPRRFSIVAAVSYRRVRVVTLSCRRLSVGSVLFLWFRVITGNRKCCYTGSETGEAVRSEADGKNIKGSRVGISGGRRKKKKGDTVRKPSELVSKKEAQRYARCRDSQSLCREVCYASLAREHRICVAS